MSKSSHFRLGEQNWLSNEPKKYRWEHARKMWRWERTRIAKAARIAGVKIGKARWIGPVVVGGIGIFFPAIEPSTYRFDPEASQKLIEDWERG